jgi:hypothetical protein
MTSILVCTKNQIGTYLPVPSAKRYASDTDTLKPVSNLAFASVAALPTCCHISEEPSPSCRISDELLVINCDKNLGPAIIEKTKYIHFAYRDQLRDSNTYEFIAPAEVPQYATRLDTVLRN